MNEIWIKPLILACIFGAILLATSVLVDIMASSRTTVRAINLRLKMISEGRTHGETLSILRRAGSAIPENLPPAILELARKLERVLMQAQLTIPTGRLMLILLIAPLVLFFIFLLILTSMGSAIGFGRILLLGTFSAVTGFLLPLMFIQWKANRTRKKMQDQFPVALDVFVRGLRAGHPIAAALDLLTVEMPDPIGSEFGLVVDEVTYGADLKDALQAMAERWDLDDMRMFVVSLAVQNETGGNLAEILENLTKVIRERQSLFMKVRALSSEGRMTAVMLTILPIFTFSLLFIANPRFYLDVAGDPWFTPGFVFLIILYMIGFYTIRRMIDLKV